MSIFSFVFFSVIFCLLSFILVCMFICCFVFLYIRCYYPYKLQQYFNLKNSSSVVRWLAGLPQGSVKDSDEDTNTTDQENVLFSSPSSSATQTPSPSTSATLTIKPEEQQTMTIKPDPAQTLTIKAEQGQAQASTSKIEQEEKTQKFLFRHVPRQIKTEPFERAQTVPPNLHLVPNQASTTTAQIHISDQPLSTTHPFQRRAASIPPMASATIDSAPQLPDQLDVILEEVELDELPAKYRRPTSEEIALGYPSQSVYDDMTHKDWLRKARRNRERATSDTSTKETKFLGLW